VIEGPLFVNVDLLLGLRTLTIGNDCYLGESVHLDIKGVVEIGDRNTISMGCHLLSHQDVGRSHLAATMPETRPGIRLGSDCYLGAGVIVLPGVTVGDSCVLGAGAVVTKSVPPQHVAVGMPATARARS
jgi:acetyltransferase-like isoleucine patch superfamily enzyme